MENKFYKYLHSMVHDLIIANETNEVDEYNMNLFYALQQTLEDLLESECTHGEHIFSMSGEELWKGIIEMDDDVRHELGIDSPEDIMNNFLSELMSSEIEEYDFAKEFLEDMASHMSNVDFEMWLNDLLKHGCISGMVGILIYNSDCKEIYVRNIDSMESMKEDLEEEVGEMIPNRHGLPHYTFLCWLCYEELGRMVYDKIFEDD